MRREADVNNDDPRLLLLPKAIDNSRVVREVDPKANQDVWRLLLLVGALVAGVALYAWPHLKLRQLAGAREQMYREKSRLTEDNRKLRLEKSSLEDLARIEALATRQLGLQSPPAEKVVVVERPAALAGEGGQVARGVGIGEGGPPGN